MDARVTIQHEDVDAGRAGKHGGDEGVDVGAEVAAVRLRQGKTREREPEKQRGERRTAPPTHEYSEWCSSHDIFESSPPTFSSSW